MLCPSSLVARRFAQEYGCLRLSVGEAMRRVMAQFPDSELSQLMQSYLQVGQTVPDDLCVLALERALLDVQCNTRGWVDPGNALHVHIIPSETVQQTAPPKITCACTEHSLGNTHSHKLHIQIIASW